MELFPILTTGDLPAALRFYRDLIGGVGDYQFPPEGDPVFVSLRIGDSTLGIGVQDEPGELTNNRITLWLYIDDCDTSVEKLRAAGVPVLQEPADQAWGERMAIVTDPDDNRVIIAERAPETGP